MASDRELQTFLDVANLQEQDIDLGRAALLLAREEYENLDVEKYLRQLDFLAFLVHRALGTERCPEKDIQMMNRVLFQEEGFVGDRDGDDPRNSYLNDVLDRRQGLPIALSIIYMEVGRRLNMPLEGVGMPLHFLVKYVTPEGELFIDPFSQGQILSEQDCRQLFREVHGGPVRFEKEWLKSVSKKAILTRMIHHLKAAYFRRQNFLQAIDCAEWILALNPEATSELRDMGFLYFHAHDLKESLAHYQQYLATTPNAPDAGIVRHNIRVLQQMLGEEE